MASGFSPRARLDKVPQRGAVSPETDQQQKENSRHQRSFSRFRTVPVKIENAMPKPDAAITLLLAALDEAYDRKSWHGTNLRGALRKLTPEDVLRRPARARHNIQEIVVHAAYWKYVVRRSLTGMKRGSFPLKGSNWFPRPAGGLAEWRGDLDLLAGEHRELRATIAAFDPGKLNDLTARGHFTCAALIRGIAAHDLYHAGQIQLLKRLRTTSGG